MSKNIEGVGEKDERSVKDEDMEVGGGGGGGGGKDERSVKDEDTEVEKI